MSILTRGGAPVGGRPSLLSNMTLQENASAPEPIKKNVPQGVARFTPIGFLCRDSEEDGGNPVQDPIGTRTGNVTPPRQSFSTDTGPNAKWIGGHYVRVSGVKQADFKETHTVLFAQVSPSPPVLRANTDKCDSVRLGEEASRRPHHR